MENWRDIKGYENIYQVSDRGNVRRLKGIMAKNTHNLKPRNGGDGYNKVVLCVNGVEKSYSIHRLVAITFLKNLENKPQVNHLDGVKANNNVTNLEWCTQSENIIHSLDIGTKKSGESHYRAKLTYDDVETIRVMHTHQLCTRYKMAEIFGVSYPAISDIINKKTWVRI